MLDERIAGADLLRGWSRIGNHLGMTGEAARRLGATAGLPHFRLGKKIVASTRTEIDAWLAAQRQQSIAA